MVDIRDQVAHPGMRGVRGQTMLDQQANRLQRSIAIQAENAHSEYGDIPDDLTPEQANEMMEAQHAKATARKE